MGKDDIKRLIAQARLDEAIAHLLEQVKTYAPASKSDKSVGKLSDILIINSGKLHGLQHDKMLGIVDHQNEQVTLAKVHKAILYVIDELPDEFWIVPTQRPTAKQNSGNEQTDLLEAVESLKQFQPGEFEYDLFVSSSSIDREFVQPVVEKLRGYGLRVFISDQNLKNYAGISFSETIQNALENSQHFILVCSPNSDQSYWVKIEWETFFNQFHIGDRNNRRIFVLKGNDFNLKFVPLFLRNMQIADNAEQIVNTLVSETKAQQRLKIKNEELRVKERKIREAAEEAEKERIENEKQAKYLFDKQLKEKQQKAEQDRLEQQKLQEELVLAELQRLVAQKAEEERIEKENHELQIEKRKKQIDADNAAKEATNPQMVFVKGGEFMMGDDNSSEKDEKPAHKVVVSDFYIGKYEVTQKEWTDIMGTNPSSFKGCDNCPVESVSWNDVQEFLKKLNQKTGKTYRLPTEAEWEYAAGGGANNRTKWAGTNTENDLGDYAWYSGNSGSKTHPIGTKKPNSLGIYGMNGNVWEWCNDWYGSDYYKSSPSNNPKGPSTGPFRVMRGGSWYSGAGSSRVADRSSRTPGNDWNDMGFRLSLAF